MTAVAPSERSAAAPPYRGRFAPTPSGPLHLGSLLTALAGWLQARTAGGRWLLRLDDLDAARSRPQHADAILQQLEAHALHWDEAPRYQSQHLAEYADAFQRLRAAGRVYACTCTRAQLARDSIAAVDGAVYAGTCRDAARPAARAAWRLRAGDGTLALHDRWRGELRRDVARDIGDFVVWRADGTPGYQLACVVDEDAQRITEVVRGTDLIGSSLRQLLLQRLLGLASPDYLHLPVLTGADGRKLSKQNHAAPVSAVAAGANLLQCLALMNQAPPAALRGGTPAEVLKWATSHWNPHALPQAAQIPVAAPPAEHGAAAAHLAS
ncbi:MAG: tRNA glutamyl-Q(34) synthetase GluQRS [Nevskia sp.]|nr:tRNA glutamyl-Q(34) synthetase GluQRS [Nevskia sp.]